jgi:hypothetical protein
MAMYIILDEGNAATVMYYDLILMYTYKYCIHLRKKSYCKHVLGQK